MRTAVFLGLYIAAAAFGTYLTFQPTFDSHFKSIQTERGDGLLNHYILENSWLVLTDPNYCGTFVSPPFYFPAKYTIYYSETLFGVAPLYWLLRLFLPLALAYAWWQILLNLLNFVAFAVVARWLRWPHLIALGSAFMWAFAMVHADQIKHQQLIGRLWMPFAVYYAIAFITEPSVKSLNRLLGSVFFQNLTCVYSGWFLVVGLATFMPTMMVLRPGATNAIKQFTRENRGKVFRIVGLWTLAMLALFGPYMLVNFGIGREYEDSFRLLPTPSAWITGPPNSVWSDTTAPIREPVSGECWLFSGFAIYLLMIASVVSLCFYRRKSQPTEWAIIAAAMFTVALWMALTLTSHDGGDSLWRWARYLPGGLAIRCTSRVYLLVYLFGIIAGLIWLTHATECIRHVWLRYAVQAIVVGFMIFEQTRPQQAGFAQEDFYPLADAAAERLKGAELGWVVPRYVDTQGRMSNSVDGEVFGMWVGLRANVPVVNGYSGRSPKGFPPMGELTDEQIRDWLKGKFHGRVRVINPQSLGQTREVVVE